jgi:ArsR family transcriptional regulator, arsenate/arsenite/antimonite-responsive transcriptional repressor
MDPKGNFEECLPIFNALGSAVRQKILFIISEDSRLSVQSLAERMNLSRPTISHHLGILQGAGIIHHHKAGRERIYYFSFEDALQKMSKLISSVERTKQ